MNLTSRRIKARITLRAVLLETLWARIGACRTSADRLQLKRQIERHSEVGRRLSRRWGALHAS